MKENHIHHPGNMVQTQLAEAALRIAARGAYEYLRINKLQADDTALAACLKSWVKAKLQEALHDAKEALDCNMGQVYACGYASGKDDGEQGRKAEHSTAECDDYALGYHKGFAAGATSRRMMTDFDRVLSVISGGAK